MPNIEVLRKALAAAQKHPEFHDQRDWCRNPSLHDPSREWELVPGEEFPVAVDNGEHPPCGTTLCMAGWIAFLNAPKGSRLAPNVQTITLPEIGRVDIEAFAIETADLTVSQAEALFYSADDADHLKAMVDVLEADPEADKYDLTAAI